MVWLIQNHIATPVYLSQITALLSDTVFINGTAVSLAFLVLHVDGRKVLVFRSNFRAQFINNKVGAAIFYDHPACYSFTNCFIYFDTYDTFCTLKNPCHSSEMNITVNFTNKAGYGSTGYMDLPFMVQDFTVHGYSEEWNRSFSHKIT